jgi:feruloyl-CoA synthase
VPLQAGARCVGDWLEQWAQQFPQRIFLGERASAEQPWTTVTYGDALQQVRDIASWILAQGMSTERPLVILSDNSIDHALLALAAMHVGVPVAAVSPAYSLIAKDYDKLRNMIALLDPGAIYVTNLKAFAPALAAIAPVHRAVIVSGEAAPGGDAIAFRTLAATAESAAVAKAFANVGPDTIAKFLFTSGSTGTPILPERCAWKWQSVASGAVSVEPHADTIGSARPMVCNDISSSASHRFCGNAAPA